MNVLLQKAAAALMIRLGERPDIIHCHDGHTAILPAMLRESEGWRHYFAKTGCVVTIHNAGIGYHQEVGDLPFAKAITCLPEALINNNLLDEKFDPLLAASSYAAMNTVSENYARELRETDDDALTGWLGHRLLARGVVLNGVTNGINPADFDPSTPKSLGLAAAFDPASGDLAGKAKCRQSLLKDLAQHSLKTVRQTGTLDDRPDSPLFTFVGRFSSQKGVDKLLGALETLLPLDQNFQVLIQGSGSKEIEAALAGLAASRKNQGRICLLRGYDQQLANRIYAAGDFFLIPSQYEPCGLTDYIAQLFGNLPIVHGIGGLVKVKDGETGFSYPEHKSAALMGAMQTALQTFRANPKKIRAMQKAAIKTILATYTWDKVLARYLSLYSEALSQVQ
jgi:starch synthase